MNWRETSDRILAVAGIIIAVCAVIVTFYQVHLMRTQAQTAVWPHIEQYSSTFPTQYQLVIYTAGLGPAVIRYLDVQFDGKTLHDWDSAAHELVDNPQWSDNMTNMGHADLPPGIVLLQGQKVTLLHLSGAGFRKAVTRYPLLVTTLCYCSLYGDCWINSSNNFVNRKVKSCPDGNTSGFYAGRNTAPKAATAGQG
ncbi:MAG: hypothetical protein ACRES7_01700 [Gammaproteobacteria bacterium]